MQTKKCEVCGTSFEPKKVFQKYCRIECNWKKNDERRRMYGRIRPEQFLIRAKKKEYSTTIFDWREYPYGAIV